MLFPYFVYIAHLTKFTRGSSLLMEKSLLIEKIKSGRKSLVKKGKEKRPKEERKSIILSRKKNSFVKVTGTSGAPRWRPYFEQVVIVKPKFSIHNVKSEVSHLYASLDTKTLGAVRRGTFTVIICDFPRVSGNKVDARTRHVITRSHANDMTRLPRRYANKTIDFGKRVVAIVHFWLTR